jgi:2-succinyl-5-enolpyruvyl-6-hydroxy-3-cyclohexene-1-carboxylate synthase
VVTPADADAHGVAAFVSAFFSELAHGGVAHVVVSPGSRSTPLTVAAARCPRLRLWPIVDERSAAFFALGLARQSGRPVALICTSGTAAANYLPAVVEAHHARVPLLVLTADRPPELRGWGAGQTIDQVSLYGAAVRRFVELPLPDGTPERLRYARALAARSVDDALGSPPGPVHLNWPLREPLEPPALPEPRPAPRSPAQVLAQAGRGDHAYTVVSRGRKLPGEEIIAELADLVVRHERGVVACGPLPPDTERSAAVAAFARAAGWPILADPASGLRCGAHVGIAPVIAQADLLLRDADFASTMAPDVVIRLGDSPVSKAQRLWLEKHPPEHLWLIDAHDGWSEPSHLASRVVRVDETLLCRAVAERSPAARRGAWTRDWTVAAERAAHAVDRATLSEEALLEPRAVRELARLLPDDATLFVASSMPIRDLDAFLDASEEPLRVLANRGANGIDGVVSSALGAAAADRGPVVALLGDLAMLHDIGGLLAARVHGLPLTFIVLNNDGGGIFSFLPVAEQGEAVDFERLFRTPHGLDFEAAANLYGLEYTRVATWDDYRQAILASLSASSPQARAHLVEVPIDRDANVKHFRELIAIAARAIGVEQSA